MKAPDSPASRPAPVAPLPPWDGSKSGTFSMARSGTFSTAIDIQVHGARADGSVAYRRKLSRGKLLSHLASQPPSTVAMEACASAHYWGREIMVLCDYDKGQIVAGLSRHG